MSGLRFNIFASDKTKRAFQSVKQNIRDLRSQFKGFKSSIKGMGPLIIGAFAGAGIRAIIQATDQIHKFSLRLGVTTESLSQLKFAGEQTGVSFNQLSLGLQRMNRRISEAAIGMGEAQTALVELGLDAQKLNAMSPDQQFKKITEAMQGVENQSDKIRLAFKLFDSEGVSLIQTMEGGAAAMDKMNERLRDLGGVVTQEQANSLAALNDAWNELTTAIKATAREILSGLQPALSVIIKAFADMVGLINKLIKTTFLLDDAFASVFAKAGEFFGLFDNEIAEKTTDNLKQKFDDIWGSTNKATNEVKSYKKELESLGKINLNTENGQNNNKTENIKTGYKLAGTESQSQQTIEKIEDIFKDGILNISKDFESLDDVARNTVKRISDIFLTSNLDQIFSDTTSSGGIGGVFSGTFGGGGGGASSMMGGLMNLFNGGFGGFFAEGGAFNAGKPIIVGERGPELIVPKAAGSVIPNENMGGSVNVVMNINTPDVSSFRQSQSQIAIEMANQIEATRRRNM